MNHAFSVGERTFQRLIGRLAPVANCRKVLLTGFLLTLGWLVTLPALGQGQVYFSNRAPGFGVDAPVFDLDGSTPVKAGQFLAQLHAGPEVDLLGAIGVPVGFRLDGYVSGGAVEVPTVAPGAKAWVELRVWEAAAGSSYEGALTNGGKVGISERIRLTTGGAGMPPSFPANLVGLKSFSLGYGAPPHIVSQPSALAVTAGQPATLTAAAEGTAPLSWQWFRNGEPLVEFRGPTLAISATAPTDEGLYRVRVTNPLGVADSETVALQVLVPPRIVVAPAGGSIFAGDVFTLRVEAAGSPPLRYQWYEGPNTGEMAPVGTDSPTHTSGALVATARFWVRVSNAAGQLLSPPADIVVTRRPQFIAFEPVATARFGTPPIALVATATSGQPVRFEVLSGPGMVDGSRLEFSGAGAVVVQATQPGDDLFLPAEPVRQTVTVAPASAEVLVVGGRQAFDGAAKAAEVSTIPLGLEVVVLYNGGAELPVLPGDYEVQATVRNPDYRGVGSARLIITGEVRGLVFHDRNGDGRHDSAEPGLSGVRVRLLTSDGASERATTETGVDGVYRFETLEAGSYLVRELDPTGFDSTTPNERLAVLRGVGAARVVFGDRPAGTISGFVFDDLDGNGRKDAAESGLAQVRIRLTQGDTPREVRSDDTGEFRFEGLAPGLYDVWEQDPDGFTSINSNHRQVELLPDAAATVPFADARVGRISGLVFEDLNGNGLGDEAEPGIDGARVVLSGDGVEMVMSTSSRGTFAFTDLAPGTYRIETTVPGTSTPVNPGPQRAIVISGGAASVSIGIRNHGVVAGEVFDDLNGNGLRNRDELGMAGVLVVLRGAGIEVSRKTDESGGFRFEGVATGTYEVAETDPEGYLSVSPNRRRVELTDAGSVWVGFADRAAGSISGLVFEDENGNQVRDAAEPGLARVEVRLIGDALERRVATMADGSFEFRGLPTGVYVVESMDRRGWVSTTPDQRSVGLVEGGSAFVSFGDQRAGRVSGTVFADGNGSGRREVGETGLPGVSVRLFGADRVRVAVSLGDGTYKFLALPPGQYTVEIETLEGFAPTTATRSPLNLADDGAVAVDFGCQPRQTVAGFVFEDGNGNLQADPGEPGLGGVGITLIRASDQVEVATSETGTEGYFRFVDLPAGDYIVRMRVPTGFAVVTRQEGEQPLGSPAVEFQASTGTVVDRPVTLTEAGIAQTSLAVLPFGSISGAVFEDLDGDGQRRAEERGLGGVLIELFAAGDPVPRRSTTSLFDGSYQFGNLSAGVYDVRQMPVDGYLADRLTVPVTVPVEGAAVAWFPNRGHGVISGLVYQDSDRDGIHDPGEAGIGGVNIALVDQAGLPSRETLTTTSGAFVFASVPAGSYRLVGTPMAGLSPTTPVEATVALSPGGSAMARFGLTLDLGAQPEFASGPVSQRVWAGSAVSFAVAVEGGEPLLVQWLKNGLPLLGATNFSMNLAWASNDDQGAYSVVVANRAATLTSDSALLTVVPEATAHRLERVVEGRRLGWQFIRPTNMAVERFRLEGSSDLVTWRPVATPTQLVHPIDNLTELVRFRDTEALDQHPLRFFRIAVDPGTAAPPQGQ